MKKKYFASSILLVSIMFIIISSVNATYAVDTASISSGIWGGASVLSNAGNLIVSAIQWIGLAILVGAVILKGIKFVSSAPDGKAEIKKEIVLLAVGAILLFTITTILNIILSLVQNAGLQ